LGVLSVLLAKGISWNAAVSAVEKLDSVPGRMQQLGSAGRAMVVIDYAHTPDALEKTLLTLQQVALERQGELWCVFGCGGDRDPGKRPQMGKIAELAQHVVVTSDNPRTEKPAAIIQDILNGMSIVPQVIEDRANAILYAIKHAGKNDVVLLAGKGHETYQDIDGKKWPFSDEEHAALALASVATNSISGGR
jgi:UDP-N-acetylmuramoyl-L-alanyl-D-glutamate--2,6-diaminopimelate ligase